MKFIGYEGARLIALFASEELRAPQGLSAANFVRALHDRYGFQVVPNLATGDLSTLTFKIGQLATTSPPISINEFTLFQSAAVIEALTTDYCEQFISDLRDWGKVEFGWREPVSPIRFRTFSACVVEFESSVEYMLGRLNDACALLSNALREEYELEAKYEIKSLLLSCDPLKLPGSAVLPDVTIQRRADFPYEANRYYCSGPFRSERLVNLMAEAEKVLGGRMKETAN